MIETERLTIRWFKNSDWRDLYEYLSLEEIYKFEPGSPISKDESKVIVKERSESKKFFAVVLKSNNKLIGQIFFDLNSPTKLDVAEIGYIFNPKYWNHGYASESARAIIKYGFEELHIHRIVAHCTIANISSWKVMEKIGLKRERHIKKNIF